MRILHLKDAAKYWRDADRFLTRSHGSQKATIQKNLVEVHTALAFLEASGAWNHHSSEMIKALNSYAVWASAEDGSFDAGTEATNRLEPFWDHIKNENCFDARITMSRGLSKALDNLTVWGKYHKERAVLATADFYCRKAVAIANECEINSVIAQIKNRSKVRNRRLSLANAGDDTKQWIRVNQFLGLASDELAQAHMHELTCEEAANLAREVRFWWQRSKVVLELCAAMDLEDRCMLDSDEFNMEHYFIAIDMYRAVLTTAQGKVDLHPALGSGVEDVEMTCVCLHFLAMMYSSVGLSKQASQMHTECVRRGLTLDIQGDFDMSDVMATGRGRGMLAQKWWFQASAQQVHQLQSERIAAEAEAYAEELKKIKPQLDRIKAENRGPVKLIKFLYDQFPPKSGRELNVNALESDDHDTFKKEFMLCMRDYSIDKQARFFPDSCMPAEHKNLHTEITKMLNHWYEVNFKSGIQQPKPEEEEDADEPSTQENHEDNENPNDEADRAETDQCDPDLSEEGSGNPGMDRGDVGADGDEEKEDANLKDDEEIVVSDDEANFQDCEDHASAGPWFTGGDGAEDDLYN